MKIRTNEALSSPASSIKQSETQALLSSQRDTGDRDLARRDADDQSLR
jgi:hypothetical protein